MIRGNQYLPVVIDLFSKCVEAFPFKHCLSQSKDLGRTSLLLLGTPWYARVRQRNRLTMGKCFKGVYSCWEWNKNCIFHIDLNYWEGYSEQIAPSINAEEAGGCSWDTMIPSILMALRATPAAFTDRTSFEVMTDECQNTFCGISVACSKTESN